MSTFSTTRDIFDDIYDSYYAFTDLAYPRSEAIVNLPQLDSNDMRAQFSKIVFSMAAYLIPVYLNIDAISNYANLSGDDTISGTDWASEFKTREATYSGSGIFQLGSDIPVFYGAVAVIDVGNEKIFEVTSVDAANRTVSIADTVDSNNDGYLYFVITKEKSDKFTNLVNDMGLTYKIDTDSETLLDDLLTVAMDPHSRLDYLIEARKIYLQPTCDNVLELAQFFDSSAAVDCTIKPSYFTNYNVNTNVRFYNINGTFSDDDIGVFKRVLPVSALLFINGTLQERGII